MTKEDVEDASGEGEQECWFGEKGCHESSEMESGSWKDCCQSGVNLATLFTGINPYQNWIDDDDPIKPQKQYIAYVVVDLR